MVSGIEDLRTHGMRDLAIGMIRWYQRTISVKTPPVCRYTPSCSQYGIEAISEWGLLKGIQLTSQRIGRCIPPYYGNDPVPLKSGRSDMGPQVGISSASAVSPISRGSLSGGKFEMVSDRTPPRIIQEYDHRFKLILAYPLSCEFLSYDDLRQKIAEFNREILAVDQFALLFAVQEVQIGEIGNYYLLRFSGTMSGSYLETQVDEVVGLLTAQLEGFFFAVTHKDFRPLYFEVDGQVIYEPQADEEALPAEYSREENLWVYTNSPDVWDVYWDSFIVDALNDLFDLLEVVDFGGAAVQGASDVPDAGSGLLDGTPEGCNLGGCDVNPLDGDGCQLDGCDAPGCDLDGCDLNGCDLSGCDGCGS